MVYQCSSYICARAERSLIHLEAVTLLERDRSYKIYQPPYIQEAEIKTGKSVTPPENP